MLTSRLVADECDESVSLYPNIFITKLYLMKTYLVKVSRTYHITTCLLSSKSYIISINFYCILSQPYHENFQIKYVFIIFLCYEAIGNIFFCFYIAQFCSRLSYIYIIAIFNEVRLLDINFVSLQIT